MEPFVRSIVAGGLSLVAGLWLATGFDPVAAPWILGAGLAVIGTAGLLYGIARPLRD